MKRDITLIALLLTYLEEFGNCHPIGPPHHAGYSATKIHYHVGLCWEAGFIEAVQVSGDETPKRYKMISLTWKGHEELERDIIKLQLHNTTFRLS